MWINLRRVLGPGMSGSPRLRIKDLWHPELRWPRVRPLLRPVLPRGVPLDLHPPQPEQRLHRNMRRHPQRLQQQQRRPHQEDHHRRSQAEEHRADRVRERGRDSLLISNFDIFSLLKVRVGEWDATGFNAPESQAHEEYTVTRILKHPDMSLTRLDNNLAILYVDRDISLNHPYVNTACLPACDNQFDFLFSNGTGVRCHVAGWGKDEVDGQFQFIPKKVDLSLIPAAQCEAKLKVALNARKPGVGDRFQLDSSEICAGGEVGKDACTGDGGSPLVCQAQSGRWTVVGLVSWGIGCASDLPGVYVDIAHYRDWINAN